MKVTDPVCGMKVEESSAAARGTYGGVPVFFCSEACRRTYERTHRASPE
jgi:Cu+-exporting ATPase